MRAGSEAREHVADEDPGTMDRLNSQSHTSSSASKAEPIVHHFRRLNLRHQRAGWEHCGEQVAARQQVDA